MTVGTFNWHAVIPVGRQNLLSNPSFEIGTAGWAGTGAGVAVGTSAASQAFGAWSLTATGISDGRGATASASLTSGSDYTASVYARLTGVSGGSVQIGLGGTTNRVPVGSAWQRIAVGTTANTTAARTLAIQAYGATGGTLWLDAAQVEAGSVTTYIDGDQEGCIWLGAAHNSTAQRDAQSRAGGSVVPLAALGLRPETHAGVGMAPAVNLFQPRAVLDGAEFQRGRYDARDFTITATITGTTVADLHQTRRRVIDALKLSRTTPPQPTRFLYTGGGAGTVQIDAVYSGGLEITDMGVIDDRVAVTFRAGEPLWRGVLEEGTSLAPYTVLGSVNYLAYRDPIGRWGTMQASGSSLTGGTVFSINAERAGTVIAGGNFTGAGGTLAPSIAMWTGAWGTLAGGTLTGSPVTVTKWINNYGTLVVGGVFSGVAGTANSYAIGLWTGAWGTTGGRVNFDAGAGEVYGLEQAPDGALVVVGKFNSVGGTTALGIARWTGAWGTLSGGTIGARAYASAEMIGGDIAVGGEFTLAGGTTVGGFAFYKFRTSTWGTYGVAPYPEGTVEAMAVTPDAEIYALSSVGSIYRFRAGGQQALPGVTVVARRPPQGDMLALPDGRVIASNVTAINTTIVTSLQYAIWTGGAWVFPDIIVSGNQYTAALEQDAAGTLYVGGAFTGIGTAAAVAQIVNTGMANAYPVLRMRNTGFGTARIYQALNLTIHSALYFDLIAYPGETITLDLNPGAKSLTSDVRGNLLYAILGGSNLASWSLQPGTNWVSFLADGAGVIADLHWSPRHESIDGGANATI